MKYNFILKDVDFHFVRLSLYSNEISPILALIFNESLARGDVPDEWRQAYSPYLH